MKKIVGGREFSFEIVKRKRLRDYSQIGGVLRVVGRAFGVETEVLQGKGGRQNTARKAALYFVQRYTGLSNEEIGRLFGRVHPSAVSKASGRLKEEMALDKELSKLVGEIDSSFKAIPLRSTLFC